MNNEADFSLDAVDESGMPAKDGQYLSYSSAAPKSQPPTDDALLDALRAYRASENDLMKATLAYPNPLRDDVLRHRAVSRLARMRCRKNSELQGRDDELLAATLQQLAKRQDGHKEDIFAAALVVTKAIADDMKDEGKSPGTCGWTKERVKEAMRAFDNPSGDEVLRQQVVWDQVLELCNKTSDEQEEREDEMVIVKKAKPSVRPDGLKGREDEMVVRALQQLGERHYGVNDDICAGALVASKEMAKKLEKCPRLNKLDEGARHVPEAGHSRDFQILKIKARARRDALDILLHTAVSYHAEHFAKKSGHLALDEDEMFRRGMRRLENKELECGWLLADFDETMGGHVLTYLKIGIESIARNMVTEAYVPKGGFHDEDIIKSVKAAQKKKTGLPFHSGTLIAAPLASGNSDDPDGPPELVPDGQWVSETLSKNSYMRVKTLREKLGDMSSHKSMVGNKKAFLNGETVEIDITENHRRLWCHWLGLSDPRYIDLSEQELADILTGNTKIEATVFSRFLSIFKPTGISGGSSKASLTRASTIGFAYMLAHPDLRQILVLMEPNSVLKNSSHKLDPEAELDALEALLRSKGKDFFRRILVDWMKKHA